jgi:hypothetical protein
MEVDMTNFLKLSVAPVAFMMMSTAAFALTPVGEVYTPEGAPKNAQYWQDFKAEPGDRHWSYAARFLKEANLTGVLTGRAVDGVYFPPEAVVMGSIEAANGPAKFTTDSKGYPSFKAGVTYRLPVPTAQGFVVASAPTNQAELDERQAFEKLQTERYNNLQAATETAYAGLSAQVQQNGTLLGTMQVQIKELAGEVKQIQGAVRGNTAAAKEALDTSNAALEQSSSALEAVASTDKNLQLLNSSLDETAQQAAAALQTANTAQADNARATMVTSNKGLLAIASGLVALMLIFSLLSRRGLAKSKDVETIQNRIDDKENGLAATRVVAEDAAELAAKTRDKHETLAEDVAAMSPTKASDITPAANALTPAELAELSPEDGKVDWSFTDQSDNQQYTVQFWRETSTPVGCVESNILRNHSTNETVEAMSVKKIPGNVARAISSGRLTSVQKDANSHLAIAAE